MYQRQVSYGLALVLILGMLILSGLLIRRPQQTLAQGPAATDSALSAADSLQLTLQSQMPAPLPLNVSNGIAYYVQSVKVGAAAAIQPHPAREGWQWVSFDLIVENTTASNVWFPSLNVNSPDWCNKVVDSGGYGRDFCVEPNPAGDFGLVREIKPLNTYYPLLLTPGVRLRLPASAEIPTVYTPASVQIFQNAQPVVAVDLTKPSDDLPIPFSETVYKTLSAQTSPSFDLLTSTYHLKVSTCRKQPGDYNSVELVCDVSLQNLSGNDMQGVPNMRSNGPVFFWATSDGDYGFSEVDYLFLVDPVPPGFTKTGRVVVGFLQATSVKPTWVWLALAASYADVPVGRLIFSVN